MARPVKIGLDYFAHDVDASNDEKVESLEALYGASGYAFYFKMLERIYRNGGFLLVSDAETKQILSRKCLVSIEEWEKILQTSLRINLFDSKIYDDSMILTSDGIKKRCEMVAKKRENMANRYKNTVSSAETRQKLDKQKKRKQKKTKENIEPDFFKNEFDKARKEYPGTKAGLNPEWANFSKKHPKEAVSIIPMMIHAIKREKAFKANLKAKGQFCPEWKNFRTWINGQHWTDEFPQEKPKSENLPSNHFVKVEDPPDGQGMEKDFMKGFVKDALEIIKHA